MSALEPIKAFFYESTTPVWLTRVEGVNATPIQQVDVTSIAFSVRDRNAVGTEHNSGALAKATVVFDVLQLDSLWTFDKIGYNFKWILTATELNKTGKQEYLVEVVFTMVDGSKVAIVAHLDQLNLGDV